MTRLILVVVLASIAVAGAACTDDNPVAPSSISNAGAFKNELVFVPDPASTCVSKPVPAHGSKPAPCRGLPAAADDQRVAVATTTDELEDIDR